MENPAPATNPTETPAPTETNKNSALIDKLQGLIDDNILMKKGSRGTRVGTVQEFLKLYGAKVTVDNDYGDTTVTAVKKFQVDQKLSADGQAGPTTYQKMIEWLREN
jgi:peptidoglycan hydrolase-like protein with peptidoglycan-binding domain